MTSGWSLKVNPPLEAAAAVVGAGVSTAAAASEGADIVGAGGEVAWRDLGSAGGGLRLRRGLERAGCEVELGGFCALGGACVRACVRESRIFFFSPIFQTIS